MQTCRIPIENACRILEVDAESLRGSLPARREHLDQGRIIRPLGQPSRRQLDRVHRSLHAIDRAMVALRECHHQREKNPGELEFVAAAIAFVVPPPLG